MNFENLPYKLKRLIAIQLNSTDLQNLRLSCKAFRQFIFVHGYRLNESGLIDTAISTNCEHTLERVQEALEMFSQLKQIYAEKSGESDNFWGTIEDDDPAEGVELQKRFQGHVHPRPSAVNFEYQQSEINPVFRISNIHFRIIDCPHESFWDFVQGIDPICVSTLSLALKSLTPELLKEIVSKFPNLQRLGITLSPQIMDHLEVLSELGSLRRLEVKGYYHSREQVIPFTSPPPLPVTHLTLSEGNSEIDFLLKSMPHLKSLEMTNFTIEETEDYEFVEAFADSLTCCSELEEIYIDDCHIDVDGGDIILHSLSQSCKIKTLVLDQFLFSDMGAEDVKKFEFLEKCKINFHEITDVSVPSLMHSLSNCTNLRQICFENYPLDSHDIEYLTQALRKLIHLEDLHMPEVDIEYPSSTLDDLLETLQLLPKLKSLELASRNLTSAQYFGKLPSLETLTLEILPYYAVKFMLSLLDVPRKFQIRLKLLDPRHRYLELRSSFEAEVKQYETIKKDIIWATDHLKRMGFDVQAINRNFN